MRHLDLFSGIGGFALAASWVWGDEHEIVSFCDNDKAAQIVLSKHWPGVPIHDDIKTLDATKWRGTIDLVTGGFPCQPFSCAGKRKGAADDRYLWPEMLRVIDECRPRWVLAENVTGIIEMELKRCKVDLAHAGYEVEHPIISACAVDAKHIRERVWIIAHHDKARCIRACGRIPGNGNASRRINASNGGKDVADATNGEPQRSGTWGNEWELENSICESGGDRRHNNWLPEPDVGRVAHGVPYRVDRLRLLGNAIVPQVAAEIFKVMRCVDERLEV
jgi:DNA (cytosine-5)-methyltransferase 1